MKIKSFYSRSVEGAMSVARQELGPDALLLNSRKAPVEAKHLGEYEVVFATDSEPAPAVASAAIANSIHRAPPKPEPAFTGNLAADVAELKKELEGMRRALTRTAFAPPTWVTASPGLGDAYAVLTANEVTPELAKMIVHGAEARSGGSKFGGPRTAPQAEAPGFQRALTEELEAQFSVEPALGVHESRTRIAALVGPPGAGKTATLVKLAVNYGLACRRPVQLLSLDTYRVAAADQLRSYASILGVGFQALSTVSALAQCLQENSGKELILIDTPGLALGEIDGAGDLARFLASRPDIDTQMVVPASMKAADLSRVIDAYKIFGPRHLLFTRLDETQAYGPLLNEAARTGTPLSFFTNGQRIPEDLEEASAAKLSRLILGAPQKLDRSAA